MIGIGLLKAAGFAVSSAVGSSNLQLQAGGEAAMQVTQVLLSQNSEQEIDNHLDPCKHLNILCYI